MVAAPLLVAAAGLALSALAGAATADGASASRADALEARSRADLAARRFAEGLPAAEEVVRLRRRAEPADPEALGTALLEYGTLLFGAERHDEADAALRDSLAAFRAVPRHGPEDDLKLARRLEQNAEIVQKGYGRREWSIELLREAVALRDGVPSSARGKLAESLVELGLQETLAGARAEADVHLARAQALLEPIAAARASDDEDRVLLVQALVLRSGLAARLARWPEADRLASSAQRIAFSDGVTRVEQRLLVLQALSTQRALAGRIDEAIDAAERAVSMMGDNAGLFDPKRAGRSLDIDTIADAFLSLGQLYLEKGNLPAARSALESARQRLDDVGELHFALAQLEQKSGHAELALEQFRTALRLRKEGASEVQLLYGTSRAPAGKANGEFGAAPGDRLTLGAASVLVPGAQFSTAAWLRPPNTPPIEALGQATDAATLLVRQRSVLDAGAFHAAVHQALGRAQLTPDAVLVFVHGFNVSFDNGLRRGAQLARDLNFDGPVAVFSWPSKGSMLAYADDRVSADAAAARLVEFLGEVALASGAARLHIVAHSMGNRVLLPAIARIAEDASHPAHAHLGEIVLAAPAVPRREFDHWLDMIVGRGVGHLTLYASNADRAMWAGWAKEGTALAGFVSDGVPLLHAGLDSIDITQAVSGEFTDLNHDVFASNPAMSEDIRRLLQAGPRLRPEERLKSVLVARKTAEGAPYWAYVYASTPVPPR